MVINGFALDYQVRLSLVADCLPVPGCFAAEADVLEIISSY